MSTRRLSVDSDRKLSIIEDQDQSFGAPMMMLPPSDDSEHYQLEDIHEHEEDEEDGYAGGDVEEGETEFEMEPFHEPETEDENEARIESEGAVRLQSEKKSRKGKDMHVSESGEEYPQFPNRVIKKLASKAGDKITNETLNALASYTQMFFQQAAGDLAAYAKHAGRKTIDETDAFQLMRRYIDSTILYLTSNGHQAEAD